uniref:Beta-defensin n=1 Tax=Neovison vison TaxID=452646 RepID=A0A8C7EKM3_NEOVI
MPLLTTNCRKSFEKLYSERFNSSTIFVKVKYSTKKNNPARSKEDYVIFNWREACIKLSGRCKNQCGEKEFKMAYCARPTTLCCMRQCDHIEININ